MDEFEQMEQHEIPEDHPLEESPGETLDRKLRACFDGKIVRKDLTKSIKEGANVPVYVLEFLLGQYCSSDDPNVIDEGIRNVKKILADNFVRPDEAQKILSILRERGGYTVIDKLTVKLNIREDRYEAEFPILASRISRFCRNMLPGTTVCFAAVSGVLSSWTMSSWRRTRRSARSAFASSRRFRCRTSTWKK